MKIEQCILKRCDKINALLICQQCKISTFCFKLTL